ncbi:hypothetical protein SERLADRAFT_394258 [Serpula lacrymans var. lacrymans S7.9]|nr:uncharacterized protein SERLADRAFT_394258 [Serpula lacrymans var. lacrymans S7.9]EGO23168.1 hypothetical protein SERLADRAFT_394258 [Serpula lacrymans var. lacrymans S7.9]
MDPPVFSAVRSLVLNANLPRHVTTQNITPFPNVTQVTLSDVDQAFIAQALSTPWTFNGSYKLVKYAGLTWRS